MNKNKANKVRQRLSNIQGSYTGHKEEMYSELDLIENKADAYDELVNYLENKQSCQACVDSCINCRDGELCSGFVFDDERFEVKK